MDRDRRWRAGPFAQVAQGAFVLVVCRDGRFVSFLVEDVHRTDPHASAAHFDPRAFREVHFDCNEFTHLTPRN